MRIHNNNQYIKYCRTDQHQRQHLICVMTILNWTENEDDKLLGTLICLPKSKIADRFLLLPLNTDLGNRYHYLPSSSRLFRKISEVVFGLRDAWILQPFCKNCMNAYNTKPNICCCGKRPVNKMPECRIKHCWKCWCLQMAEPLRTVKPLICSSFMH